MRAEANLAFAVELVGATPSRDALDDEEALAGLHVAQATGLSLHGGGSVPFGEAPLEPLLLRAQLPNLGRPFGERVPGRDVAPERLGVEKGDEEHDADGKPTQEEPSAWNAVARSPLLGAATGHSAVSFAGEAPHSSAVEASEAKR
jgi:hypothetical protein